MDTNKGKSKWRGTSGLLSLEASIALTVFIFLMLFLASFFVVFEARNEMGHVLLTTADSLSLDAFANEAADDDTVQEILYKLYGNSTKSNGTFTNADKWYDGDQATVENAIRERFTAYLGGGTEEEANRVLESLNITTKVADLDFSASRIENGQLYLEVRYKLQYEYRMFGLGEITLSQSCRSKLWK